MATDSLRVGVIGLGMGSAHAVAYQGVPNAELVAVCDISVPWAKTARRTKSTLETSGAPSRTSPSCRAQ